MNVSELVGLLSRRRRLGRTSISLRHFYIPPVQLSAPEKDSILAICMVSAPIYFDPAMCESVPASTSGAQYRFEALTGPLWSMRQGRIFGVHFLAS